MQYQVWIKFIVFQCHYGSCGGIDLNGKKNKASLQWHHQLKKLLMMSLLSLMTQERQSMRWTSTQCKNVKIILCSNKYIFFYVELVQTVVTIKKKTRFDWIFMSLLVTLFSFYFLRTFLWVSNNFWSNQSKKNKCVITQRIHEKLLQQLNLPYWILRILVSDWYINCLERNHVLLVCTNYLIIATSGGSLFIHQLVYRWSVEVVHTHWYEMLVKNFKRFPYYLYYLIRYIFLHVGNLYT